MNNDLEWSKPKEYPISQIQTLLENGYEVEVDSPDGYIPVNYFINKGMHQEYVLKVDDVDIDTISCNGEHLFETSLGWYSARHLAETKEEVNILTKNGYKKGIVSTTDKTIPIVDINVEHKNHRYYTNNVSSHNTGVGKSLGMCHIAASSLLQGKNVLYITMEMAEERIAERIDANLLDIPIDQLDKMPKTMFTEKVNNLAKKTVGKLIVKEYPTGAAHAGHFRALLKELKLKKSFIPDIIFIDYLNICASSRMKSMGGAINSYTYVKAIAEELRGIAVEFAVPVVSATQTTRSGFSNSDPGLEDTSESFGLPATADLMLAFVSNEELEQSGQIMVKQLKNRYNDPNRNKRFVVGIDRSKMRLYDAEATDQTLIDDGIPVFDKTPSGDKFKDFKI